MDSIKGTNDFYPVNFRTRLPAPSMEDYSRSSFILSSTTKNKKPNYSEMLPMLNEILNSSSEYHILSAKENSLLSNDLRRADHEIKHLSGKIKAMVDSLGLASSFSDKKELLNKMSNESTIQKIILILNLESGLRKKYDRYINLYTRLTQHQISVLSESIEHKSYVSDPNDLNLLKKNTDNRRMSSIYPNDIDHMIKNDLFILNKMNESFLNVTDNSAADKVLQSQNRKERHSILDDQGSYSSSSIASSNIEYYDITSLTKELSKAKRLISDLKEKMEIKSTAHKAEIDAITAKYEIKLYSHQKNIHNLLNYIFSIKPSQKNQSHPRNNYLRQSLFSLNKSSEKYKINKSNTKYLTAPEHLFRNSNIFGSPRSKSIRRSRLLSQVSSRKFTNASIKNYRPILASTLVSNNGSSKHYSFSQRKATLKSNPSLVKEQRRKSTLSHTSLQKRNAMLSYKKKKYTGFFSNISYNSQIFNINSVAPKPRISNQVAVTQSQNENLNVPKNRYQSTQSSGPDFKPPIPIIDLTIPLDNLGRSSDFSDTRSKKTSPHPISTKRVSNFSMSKLGPVLNGTISSLKAPDLSENTNIIPPIMRKFNTITNANPNISAILYDTSTISASSMTIKLRSGKYSNLGELVDTINSKSTTISKEDQSSHQFGENDVKTTQPDQKNLPNHPEEEKTQIYQSFNVLVNHDPIIGLDSSMLKIESELYKDGKPMIEKDRNYKGIDTGPYSGIEISVKGSTETTYFNCNKTKRLPKLEAKERMRSTSSSSTFAANPKTFVGDLTSSEERLDLKTFDRNRRTLFNYNTSNFENEKNTSNHLVSNASYKKFKPSPVLANYNSATPALKRHSGGSVYGKNRSKNPASKKKVTISLDSLLPKYNGQYSPTYDGSKVFLTPLESPEPAYEQDPAEVLIHSKYLIRKINSLESILQGKNLGELTEQDTNVISESTNTPIDSNVQVNTELPLDVSTSNTGLIFRNEGTGSFIEKRRTRIQIPELTINTSPNIPSHVESEFFANIKKTNEKDMKSYIDSSIMGKYDWSILNEGENKGAVYRKTPKSSKKIDYSSFFNYEGADEHSTTFAQVTKKLESSLSQGSNKNIPFNILFQLNQADSIKSPGSSKAKNVKRNGILKRWSQAESPKYDDCEDLLKYSAPKHSLSPSLSSVFVPIKKSLGSKLVRKVDNKARGRSNTTPFLQKSNNKSYRSNSLICDNPTSAGLLSKGALLPNPKAEHFPDYIEAKLMKTRVLTKIDKLPSIMEEEKLTGSQRYSVLSNESINKPFVPLKKVSNAEKDILNNDNKPELPIDRLFFQNAAIGFVTPYSGETGKVSHSGSSPYSNNHNLKSQQADRGSYSSNFIKDKGKAVNQKPLTNRYEKDEVCVKNSDSEYSLYPAQNSKIYNYKNDVFINSSRAEGIEPAENVPSERNSLDPKELFQQNALSKVESEKYNSVPVFLADEDNQLPKIPKKDQKNLPIPKGLNKDTEYDFVAYQDYRLYPQRASVSSKISKEILSIFKKTRKFSFTKNKSKDISGKKDSE
ncbi:hypothetical protein BB560_005301 [Smittium megazygosporum]|uniref:Uncharacterized protein n=1 Tax=Smittium megazygosporum TaxID=133381 RepID=A0A2T9Z6V4_9FUNG|nr:hypothetical protein BB560_005301 [Smittium megazygosporum]